MNRPLDFWLFGNGHGIAQPYFDGRFYWLVDAYERDCKYAPGTFYTWIGGHGAQLRSFQWTHPKPGERRRLSGHEFRPFHSTRKGPRVVVSWATRLPKDIDKANATLRHLKSKIGNP